MGRKHLSYPADQVKDLKTANRRLKSENLKLKSELATLTKAFEKTKNFLHKETYDVPLRDLLDGAKKEKKLESIKNRCEKCDNKELTIVTSADRIIYICKSCKYKFIKRFDPSDDY